MVITYLWFLLIFVAGMGAAYLYRSNFRGAGLFLGTSSLVIGIAGLVTASYGINGMAFQALWIATSFSLVGTMYLAIKTSRALLFFIVPLFLLGRALVSSLPLFVLFASLSLIMGIVDAFDFSRLDITACMKNGDKPLRVLLSPFSRLENLVKRIADGRKRRPVLFFFYFLLSIVLVAISVLVIDTVSKASGENVLVSFVLLPSLAYLSASRRECARGLARLSSSQNKDINKLVSDETPS